MSSHFRDEQVLLKKETGIMEIFLLKMVILHMLAERDKPKEISSPLHT
jgi:hypothetical protein